MARKAAGASVSAPKPKKSRVSKKKGGRKAKKGGKKGKKATAAAAPAQ
jgi:hypothetical protein